MKKIYNQFLIIYNKNDLNENLSNIRNNYIELNCAQGDLLISEIPQNFPQYYKDVSWYDDRVAQWKPCEKKDIINYLEEDIKKTKKLIDNLKNL